MSERASVVGCYVMHLYCALGHDDNEPPANRKEYTGGTAAECRKEARRDGWEINKNRAVCPDCVKEAKSKRWK